MGIESQGPELHLLILDPLHGPKLLHTFLMNPAPSLHMLRKSTNQLRHKEYEIVFVDGVINDEEKEVSSNRIVLHPYLCDSP